MTLRPSRSRVLLLGLASGIYFIAAAAALAGLWLGFVEPVVQDPGGLPASVQPWLAALLLPVMVLGFVMNLVTTARRLRLRLEFTPQGIAFGPHGSPQKTEHLDWADGIVVDRVKGQETSADPVTFVLTRIQSRRAAIEVPRHFRSPRRLVPLVGRLVEVAEYYGAGRAGPRP